VTMHQKPVLRAVVLGHATITVPSLLIMLTCGFAAYLLSGRLFSAQMLFAEPARLVMSPEFSLPLACWWWRSKVHRWRKWTQSQRIDPERLEKLAVRTLLVWPIDALNDLTDEHRWFPSHRLLVMYGPPPCLQAKSENDGWSAQMYSALVGVKTPGRDGMRCALFPISYAVSKTSAEFGFWERRVRPLCHLLVRQQTWQEHRFPQPPWCADVGIAKRFPSPS
jgi:hypothetical protein